MIVVVAIAVNVRIWGKRKWRVDIIIWGKRKWCPFLSASAPTTNFTAHAPAPAHATAPAPAPAPTVLNRRAPLTPWRWWGGSDGSDGSERGRLEGVAALEHGQLAHQLFGREAGRFHFQQLRPFGRVIRSASFVHRLGGGIVGWAVCGGGMGFGGSNQWNGVRWPSVDFAILCQTANHPRCLH